MNLKFVVSALAFLLMPALALADDLKEVRIATVVYDAGGGKTRSIGSTGIIDDQGYLKDELAKRGIKLTWVPVSAQGVGATINEAFANHSIDFAGYGDLPSVILNAGGIDTRILIPGSSNNVYLVVPPDSPVKSIVDLRGKRIALHRGRPWEVSFARLAEANGLKLSDFNIVNLNPGAGAAALAAGNVDAYVSMSDAYTLEDKKVGKIIWSTKAEGESWKMRAELWGAKSFIDQYPDITQIIVTAYVRAAYWISQDAHRDDYIKLAALSGQPESVIRREYDGDSVSWKDQWSPLFTDAITDHYRYVANYSRSVNLIGTDLDTDSLFDKRFVPVALKELQLEKYWGTTDGKTGKPKKTAQLSSSNDAR